MVGVGFAYVAPEIVKFRSFICGMDLDKCDVYSLGLCVLENITGMPVSLLKRELNTIKTNNEKYLRGYSPSLRAILTKMVYSDPTKRPTA
jgi:serine/threonine protein kinase